MKRHSLKLVVHNVILCFSLMFLFSVSNCYSLQDNVSGTTENNDFENANNNSVTDSNSQKSEGENNDVDVEVADENSRPLYEQKIQDDSNQNIQKNEKVEKVAKNKGAKLTKKKKNFKETKREEENTKQVSFS